MSAESELLIKIKTILESEGVDAAKKHIDDLSKSNQKNTLTQGQATIEMQKATRAAFALRMAADGSTQGFRGLANAAMMLGQGIGSLVGKITLVGAAFSAGWKIGTLIREQFVTPLSEAEKALEDVESQAKKASDRWNEVFKRIEETEFAKLRKELEAIQTSYNDAISSAERLYRINTLISKSEEERDVAELNLRASKSGMSKEGRDEEEQAIRYRYELKRLDMEEVKLQQDKSSELTAKEKASFNLGKLRQETETSATAFEDQKRMAEQAGLSQFLSAKEIKDREFNNPEFNKRFSDKEADINKHIKDLNYGMAFDPSGDAGAALKLDMEKAQGELKKLNKLRLELQKLAAAAFEEKKALDKFNSESGAPKLESDIKTSTGKLEELDAQIAALATRKENAKTNQEAIFTKRSYDLNKAEDEKDPRKVRNQAQQTLLDSLYVKDDTPLDNAGQPLSIAAQQSHDEQRRSQAVIALQKAQSLVVAGEDPESVYKRLIPFLDRLGVTLDRSNKEKSEIIAAIDRLDGKVGKLETNVSNLNSQSSASPAFQ